ncbi:hypothetical protein FQR65_LT01147 [Abscondita terminalis]|nr:hypothetical protein FQR65_LT01147 [Abscondita terminalis]
MFKLVIACAFLAVVCGAPASEKHVEILSQESSVDADGKYHYKFASGDGTKAEQSGELKKIGNEAGVVSQGYYEYQDGGVTFKVTYTADENGFVATGDHIPVIPEIIARALKWAAEHPYKEPERKH